MFIYDERVNFKYNLLNVRAGGRRDNRWSKAIAAMPVVLIELTRR